MYYIFDFLISSQAIVNWLCTPDVAVDNPPPLLELHQLTSIHSHQSGVNSLSIKYCHQPTDGESHKSNLNLTTGGDDNKLSVWDIMVDTSEEGFTKITSKFLCSAIGHSSQITGRLILLGPEGVMNIMLLYILMVSNLFTYSFI